MRGAEYPPQVGLPEEAGDGGAVLVRHFAELLYDGDCLVAFDEVAATEHHVVGVTERRAGDVS